MTAFLDEAGNTGADFLDPAQPAFSLAAIGVLDSRIRSLEREFERLKQRYRIPVTQEIHARRLLRSTAAPFALDILRALRVHGALLVASMVEKRFFICGHIIEDFLDPMHNPLTTNIWTHPLPVKVELSNVLYETLSETTLQVCGRAFRSGEGMSEALNCVLRDVHGLEHRGLNLGRLLGGAAVRIDDFTRTTASVAAGTDYTPAGGVSQSPNFTCYGSVLMNLDTSARDIPACVDVVFDSSRQFDETFRIWFDLLRNISDPDPAIAHMIQIRRCDALRSFAPAPSHAHPMLQIADIVATGLNTVLELAIRNESRSDPVAAGFSELLRELTSPNRPRLDLVASQQVKVRIGPSLS